MTAALDLPFVPARWFTPGPRNVPIRMVCIHDMEALEGPDTAESCAHYFATIEKKSSAHVCADDNSMVRCVNDGDIAYHAPGANSDGLGIELAGYARQSREDWLDDYGHALLRLVAKQVASWCQLYDIPVRWLSAAEMVADKGARGITTHVEVNNAFHESDHTDPGPNFPMDVLLQYVLEIINPEIINPQEDDDMTAARIVGFTEYGNRWLVGAGPALNLSGPLADSYKAAGVVEVVGPRHDQMLKGLLEQSGLAENDLVPA